MPKQIVIAEKHQVAAVFWKDQIQELVVSTGSQQVGDIYLGLVDNILPSIDAAFINIGDTEKNGFIHVSDLGPIRLRRTSASITELLAPQQRVLVQVMKEPTGNKGPRLTGNISMPGRYIVLMPHGRGVNLSRRINREEERSRLRALAVLIKPPGMGLLVRTEAEDVPEDAIIEDLENLQRQWELVQQQAMTRSAPMLLDRDDDFIKRVLRDMYSSEVNRIVVDTPAGMKRVKQQLMNWDQGRLPEGVLIDCHREALSILEYFRVNATIREALKPRVDLPSGGYVIIEPTEALTVIDVNSGSFTHSANSRETVLWTNYEAATEIARQLKLRNIGGVVIVDFIDMDSHKDQLQLLEHFNRCLESDKARPQIAQLTELGLVELTRKRQGQNLYELFGQTCPECGGLGHLVELPGEKGFVSLAPTAVSSSIPPRLVEKPILSPPSPKVSEAPKKEEAKISSPLDLLFHPNYQEQGDRDVNRRRRRRRGSDFPEKETTKSLGTSRSKGASPTATKEKPATIAPQRRERPARRVEKPLVPLDIAMTPLEQDIYARMGISPLIKTEYADQDPRSFVVSVITAGTSSGAEVNGNGGQVGASTHLLDNGNGSPDEVKTVLTEVETASVEEQGKETNETMDQEKGDLPISIDDTQSSPKAEVSVPVETKKRPGRRRRRSSAE
ncbi:MULTISPECIES: Rne/Rng family ribonuclease [unclassified Synechocystis]|uniref:Rne/Rng family ribonuclease n=1 Tax=unclassified Synechocystis TaxID=2640012 RepID=UPI00041F1F1E|nr:MULTISPECIES: Rne/Rng family ribonuclease [unclassified Synechocystis]AIE74592.1 Cytoplasmic axial filament protein CafA and Ribonuclease G [Synechocystis sp. PCC 6714]MCT0254043.1 Rne/Rng family ribonuclease [Synechocystis sp. CS-94]